MQVQGWHWDQMTKEALARSLPLPYPKKLTALISTLIEIICQDIFVSLSETITEVFAIDTLRFTYYSRLSDVVWLEQGEDQS